MNREIDTDSGPAFLTPFGAAPLRDVFEFDATTGNLWWKARPMEWFPDSGAGGKQWNANWTGKRALASVTSKGYLAGLLFRRPVKAHRVVFAMYCGHWPKGQIDHQNRDRADNRPENLRDVTQTENMRNTKLQRNNSTGTSGVSFHKGTGKYRVRIGNGVARDDLGYFVDLGEAVAARKVAEVLLGYSATHGVEA